jgi:hypothetical protein
VNGLAALQALRAELGHGDAPAWSSAQDAERVLATEQALTEGGDARIALDASGRNAYGCAPRPDAALVALGSSTASVISPTAFDAALALHARLSGRPLRWQPETERIRHEIAVLSGAAQVAGSEVVLAASGTDVHLIALQLAGDGERPVQAVMIDSAETGSGVGAALAGHHFADRTCLGAPVQRGTPLGAADAAVAPIAIALREADGRLRDAAEVDAEFAAQVERVVQSGRRCLLVLADVSKTGLSAPSLGLARACVARHGAQVEVMVDACQFRLAPASIAAYLAHGFLVAVTGSKFVTGPAFSGALLLPPALAQRAQHAALAPLRAYASRSHWPTHWHGVAALHEARNLGLLLRWEAALAELRAFAAVPPAFVDTFLQCWSDAVNARLADDGHFDALPVAPLRRGLGTDAHWDERQSIVPFVIHRGRASLRRVLTRAETAALHRELQQPVPVSGRAAPRRFQLGQPVLCGQRADTPVSALRLCASARLIAAAWARQDVQAEMASADALAALDRIAHLADRLPA